MKANLRKIKNLILKKQIDQLKALQNVGVRVVNISYKPQELLSNLIDEFPDMLFVVSAGNDSLDLDNISNLSDKNFYSWRHRYPESQNLIVVGWAKLDGSPHPSSNYGRNEVDLFAQAGHGGGTSTSALSVSILSANIMRNNPSLSASEVKNLLCSTVTQSTVYKSLAKCTGYIEH